MIAGMAATPRRLLFPTLCLLAVAFVVGRAVRADDGASAPATRAFPDLQPLIAKVQPSVVVISFTDRDGAAHGLGTGFVIRADGLIATNLHVLGEARPIAVRTKDGKRYDVTAVHAHERSQDLALIKVDAQDLPALELGDSDALAQGQPVVAFGNPQGLEHSVVTGIVSGLRENVDGRPMIQLAIPIERGNSGGPVVDFDGRVQGILTLKSLVTENLGYAAMVNSLKPLIEKPNPILMSKWLTIGALNPRRWTDPRDGVRWTQHAGHLHARGTGQGFGGRSLCLSTIELPDLPCEIAVSVRMDENDGAAGLVFHSDGGDRHFGFYPSSGELRLSRFDGPIVQTWEVLFRQPSPHYREGDWNRLKVRIEADRLLCYCNDELVYESRDRTYTGGRVGLAKFRHTTAEFKGFAVGREISPERPPQEVFDRVAAAVADIPTKRPPTDELISQLLDAGTAGTFVLEERARLLDQQAQRLRQLARAVHERRIRDELVSLLDRADHEIDLLHAALLIAALDNDELDVASYRSAVDDLAAEFTRSQAEGASESDKLAAFNTFLFEEQGFHGSRTNYYHASNSYLNEVIDDREGLPITLSVLYIELARRAGLKVVGIGLPGHFVVQFVPAEGEPRLIDVFEQGAPLAREDARRQVAARGLEWDDEYLRPQSPREIVTRMLRNLLGLANGAQDAEGGLRYVETVLALNPDSVQDHLTKAMLCGATKRIDEGLAEFDWVLERRPEGVLLERVQQHRDFLQQRKTE
jgi:regulator of sirC expression with transglutaminase-like and TPR domain